MLFLLDKEYTFFPQENMSQLDNFGIDVKQTNKTVLDHKQ